MSSVRKYSKSRERVANCRFLKKIRDIELDSTVTSVIHYDESVDPSMLEDSPDAWLDCDAIPNEDQLETSLNEKAMNDSFSNMSIDFDESHRNLGYDSQISDAVVSDRSGGHNSIDMDVSLEQKINAAVQGELTFLQKIRSWVIGNIDSIKLRTINQLLMILREEHPELPKTARQLLGFQHKIKTKQILTN
uniref:Uncharacterized protein n=1 Tax=Bracon brevicornis TaxID=1563983 RepID=A0A6V7KTR2_9HYME